MPKHALLITFLSTLSLLVPPAAADDYWQQEVNYRIDVTLANDLRTINGSIDIEYINNSPDTLGVVFLKAFPNAIQKGSYSDLKRRTMNDYSFANLKPEQEGSLKLYHRTGIDDLHRPYRTFEFDNTVVTVYLNRPLLPGDTVTLPFDFKTILPRPSADSSVRPWISIGAKGPSRRSAVHSSTSVGRATLMKPSAKRCGSIVTLWWDVQGCPA